MHQNEKKLRKLINSFERSALAERLPELIDYIEHNEFGLSLEILSSWIYEYDVAVLPEQEERIMELSDGMGIPRDYHSFVGRTPPYPDLRTPEQKA